VILRRLVVEHFACIGRLELADLPVGLVLLSGPNGLGKSTLVRAIRTCLFDVDHDSSCVKSFAPWNGQGPPRVAVEFETAGQRFRLDKVFARGKEGAARLEKLDGGQWCLVERGKEASRKTRELLGADRSHLGLNQLLWLAQGEYTLPDGHKLDPTLQQRLVDVLGALVTGRDLAFKQRLEEHYARWYGARGTFKPTSPVQRLAAIIAERKQRRDELRARFTELEQVMADLERLQDRLPSAEQEVQNARRQLAVLRQEAEQGRQRRFDYEQARLEAQRAEQRLQAAEQQWQAFQQARQRWQKALEEAEQAQAACAAGQQEQQRWADELALATQQLEEVRTADDRLDGDRQVLDDRRTLLQLAADAERLEQTRQHGQELQESIRLLEAQLAEMPVPEAARIEELRTLQREAQQLRAQLQAEAVLLSLELIRPGPVRIRVDEQQSETVNLPAGQAHTWPLRQAAELEIPGVGRVVVQRSAQDRARKRVERLAELDRRFRQAAAEWRFDPDDAGCLDQLAERRIRHEADRQHLAELRRQLARLAPDGLEAVARQLEDNKARRQEVLLRRPELADWMPDPQAVADQEQELQQQSAELLQLRKAREQAVAEARQRARQAEERLAAAGQTRVRAQTTADNLLHELRRLGDELSLDAARQRAVQALDEAHRRLAETELTEREKTIDQRLCRAESEQRQREADLQEVKNELIHLRGQLAGSEGLPTRLADAEAELQQAEAELARETLEAQAHKRLYELFDRCRDRQVHDVLAPVGSRVLDWAHSLGMSDYRSVCFGKGFMPEGIVRRNGGVEEEHALAEESFGTAEQLGLLVRLALGGLLARGEPAVAILDDPLTHADASRHRRCLEILRQAAAGDPAAHPPAGPLQVLLLTCHPERFQDLPAAQHIDLSTRIRRE
jgi:DNA repair ATPase RecN